MTTPQWQPPNPADRVQPPTAVPARKRKWKVKTLLAILGGLLVIGVIGSIVDPVKPAVAPAPAALAPATSVTTVAPQPAASAPTVSDDPAARSAAVSSIMAELSGRPGFPGDPDYESCQQLTTDIVPLERTLKAQFESGTVDYANASAGVSTFSVEARATEFGDPSLRAVWDRAAANGEVTAQVLLEQDYSSSDQSVATWGTSVVAAINVCRTYSHLPTG